MPSIRRRVVIQALGAIGLGGLNQSLKLNIDCGRPVRSAGALVMSAGALDAIGGITIQGAAVTNDGDEPNASYTAPFSGNSVRCYLGALEAICITVA